MDIRHGSDATSTASPSDGVHPYRIHTSFRYLDLTQKKLDLTRLPKEADAQRETSWDVGAPKDILEPLIDFWLERYSWRDQEANLNMLLPQFRVTVPVPYASSLRIHFVHKRSSNPNAIPLLFCHGWPGSFIEVSKVINDLTEPRTTPTAYQPVRMDDLPFHVVSPSVPGFGFSDPSPDPNFGLRGTSYVFNALMEQLGYNEYVTHGTGWGFEVCRSLALHHPKSCAAVHTANPSLPAPCLTQSPLQYLRYRTAQLAGSRFSPLSFGYSASDLQPTVSTSTASTTHMSGTAGQACGLEYSKRPQTSSYALCDSPAGLLACVLDSVHDRTSTSRTLGHAWKETDIINWTMLQWLPGPEAGLRWLRASQAELHGNWNTYSAVPLGISSFQDENARKNATVASRSPDLELGESSGPRREPLAFSSPPLWAQSVQNLIWVKRHGRYSLRPSWEEAEELVGDLRAFVTRLVSERRIRVGS